MTNFLYAFLAHSWSGAAIAALVALFGWLVVRLAIRSGRPRARLAGFGLYVVAAALGFGSVITMLRVHQIEADHPPPGRLVDVGGYRMHILAEGESRGRATLVWLPGGHAPGLAFYGHHRQLRGEARSILFDRAGSGWSDAGPFPRRTPLEAREMATLLERAGERGPFILVGHSAGGLLAANYARRHPDRVAGLILLDAMQPDMVAYNRYVDGDGVGSMARFHLQQGVLTLFGIRYDPFEQLARDDPQIARLQRLHEIYMGDQRAALEAKDGLPMTNWASLSINGELDPQELSKGALEWLVYDGELGDLPLWIVIPQDEVQALIESSAGNPQKQRALRLFQRMQHRYLQASSRARLVHAPPGTGHNFPYEAPDFVTELVRNALREIDGEH